MRLDFERPALIAAAFLALVLFLLYLRRGRKSFALELPLGAPGGVSFKPPFGAEALVRLLRGMEIAGAALLILAAAGPVVVSTETLWLDRGADVLFILDVSPSMAAQDMGGRNRLDAARDLVRGFVEARRTDAAGLVAVGADAALLVPPTVDRRVFLERLDALAIAELGDGTALGMGLATAAHHLKGSRAPRRAAILITDGENNAGAVHPATAAGALRTVGASLWVIGVGSTGEVPIEYIDPSTKMRRTGTFDSRFDPEALRSVARSGGGTYFAAPSAEAFAEAFSRVDAAEATVQRTRKTRRTTGVHGPFILAAAALLAAARFVRRSLLGALL